MIKKVLVLFSLVFILINADSGKTDTLFKRLGGYDAIAAVSRDFHLRLKNDPQLGRFWAYRGTDGMERELQLLIDFICAQTGGPTYYPGRGMAAAHVGMKINESDWKVFMKHLKDTLDKYKIKEKEQKEVLKFINSLKSSIVES